MLEVLGTALACDKPSMSAGILPSPPKHQSKLLRMPELRHFIGVQGILKNEGTLRSRNSLTKVPGLLPDSGQLLDSECGRVNRQTSPAAPVQVRKEAQGRCQGCAPQRTGVATKEKGRRFSISWTRRPGRPALPLPLPLRGSKPVSGPGIRAMQSRWDKSQA